MKHPGKIIVLIYLYAILHPHFLAANTGSILIWNAFTPPGQSEWKNLLLAIDHYLPEYRITNTQTVDPAVLKLELENIDTLLLPVTFTNSDADEDITLAETIRSFANVFENFVNNGGKLVLMGADDSVLRNLQLIDATYRGTKESPRLQASNLSHPLFEGVKTMEFEGSEDTYYYSLGSGSTDTQVLIKYQKYSVLAHRTLGAGHVILLGYDLETYDPLSAQIVTNALKKTLCLFSVRLTQSEEEYTIGQTVTAQIAFDYTCKDQIAAELRVWYSPEKGKYSAIVKMPFNVTLREGDSFVDTYTFLLGQETLIGGHEIGFTLLDLITGETIRADAIVFKVVR